MEFYDDEDEDEDEDELEDGDEDEVITRLSFTVLCTPQ